MQSWVYGDSNRIKSHQTHSLIFSDALHFLKLILLSVTERGLIREACQPKHSVFTSSFNSSFSTQLLLPPTIQAHAVQVSTELLSPYKEELRLNFYRSFLLFTLYNFHTWPILQTRIGAWLWCAATVWLYVCALAKYRMCSD